MTRAISRQTTGAALLGIECGATRSAALFTDGHQAVEWQGGPANLRLLSERGLHQHFRAIAKSFPHPAAIAIGMAGVRTAADQERIRRAAARVWSRIPCQITNDLEPALAAAEPAASAVAASVLVLSGTGSCCYGRNRAGRAVKIGGWGHVLGDKGSGYEIGLRALKAAVFYYDRDGVWSRLGQRILRALQLNEPEDLINWAQAAGKADLAALAVEVFAARAERDRIAGDILEGAAHSLAKDAVTCAAKLAKAGQPVQFVFAGSVLLKQPAFARQVARVITQQWPPAVCGPLKRAGTWGAVELARRLIRNRATVPPVPPPPGKPKNGQAPDRPWDIQQIAASPTEQRNPRSLNLDRLGILDAVELMLSEDAKIPRAIRREAGQIAWVVDRIARAFEHGGRLFYAGAGTSGRLGILDASECPPTFCADPEMVQAIIAGGQNAIWMSLEGAEDDPEAGARAVQFRGVRRGDVLVGIAASGRTPFVWGALWEAKRRGATAVLLCFNPRLKVRPTDRPHRIIAPNLGPEVLTGSTRLKAGTATKLILNMFTTLAMVRIGKVSSNLMIDVKASNIKLRDRATRIACALTGADYAAAHSALEKTGWRIKEACARLKTRRSG